METRKTIAHLALAGAVLALAACGGGGGDSTPVTTAAAATAGGTTAAAGTTAGGTTATTTSTATTTAAATTTTSALTVAALLNIDTTRLPDYSAALPAYYDAAVVATDNTPAGTAVDNRVATLGRVLFYDKRLSVNDTVACASCHQQALGFSDGKRFSTGFSGNAFTTAHSMRLGNVRYWQPGNMFWDRRAATLEAQASQPIQNSVEMGFDASAGGINALIAKMNALPYYRDLFTLAFGDAAISEARIQRALAMFQRAMVSTASRWDTAAVQVFNPALPANGFNQNLPGFTAQENRGRQLFMTAPPQGGAGCAACHVPPTFSLAANSRSNGLDAGETTVFKSPSLKNVALSSAFMHDGRFSTLDQVVEHYNSGVQAGQALDNRLRPGGQPQRLNLSDADKAALVAFMRTLSDPNLVADTRFSTPFK